MSSHQEPAGGARRVGFPAWVVSAAATVALAAACTGASFADPTTTVAEGADGADGAVTTTLPVIPEAVPAGATLLDERFDGEAARLWTGSAGWAPIGYGEAMVWSASGAAWSWYPDGQAWADYAVTFDSRVDAGGLAVGVRAGPEGRYVVHVGTAVVGLVREQPWGEPTVLATTMPLEPNRSHALSVAVVGGHLQVWSDGRLILEYSDPNPLPAGTVTFGAADGSVAWIDGLRITSLGAPLPPARPATARGDAAAVPPDLDAEPEGGPFAAEPAPTGEPNGGNDLDLGVVRFDRAAYTQGDPVTVSAEVALAGEGPVGPFTVRVDVGDVGCDAAVQSLSNFGSTVATCTTPGIGQAGLPVWRVNVDDQDQVVESDETDNASIGALVVTDSVSSPMLPDVVVMWWATEPAWPPRPDEPVDIRVRVGPLPPHEGEIPAYGVAVSLDGAILCDVEVASPSPATLSCPLDTGIGVGRHVLGIVVDSSGVVAEGDGEAGNTYEVIIDL